MSLARVGYNHAPCIKLLCNVIINCSLVSSQVHEELAVLRDGVLQLLHGAGHGALVPEGGPGVAEPRLQAPQVLLQLPPVLAEN